MNKEADVYQAMQEPRYWVMKCPECGEQISVLDLVRTNGVGWAPYYLKDLQCSKGHYPSSMVLRRVGYLQHMWLLVVQWLFYALCFLPFLAAVGALITFFVFLEGHVPAILPIILAVIAATGAIISALQLHDAKGV